MPNNNNNNKQYITVIFRIVNNNPIPEYTIDQIFTDPLKAQLAGEDALHDILSDPNKDVGTYTFTVLTIPQ